MHLPLTTTTEDGPVCDTRSTFNATMESLANVNGLVFTLVMCVLMVVLPRRYALVPVVIVMCFMTMGQAVLVMGLHFSMIRILALFGWTRLLLRREIRSLKLNAIDKAVIWWVISSVVINALLWQTSDALINRLGLAYNAAGMYFLFRYLLRNDLEDIIRVFKITAVLVIPLAVLMVMEKMSGRNMFAVFGGVDPVTALRDGVLRCQGPFQHPILAGTFGATLLPLFIALWQQGRGNRLLAFLGILSSAVITVTSGSSGPILASLAGVAAVCAWPLRQHFRVVLAGVLLVLITLQVVMKAPVWFLMARMDVFSGSTGFHRALVMDQAIAHFFDWWLLGTKSVESWGEALHGDITNEYVWQAINGGLLTLILFIVIIVRCFRKIGRVQALKDQALLARRCIWGMGAALFAHVVTFFSVQYFDQNFVNWYLLLAFISVATSRRISIRFREPIETSGILAPLNMGLDAVISTSYGSPTSRNLAARS